MYDEARTSLKSVFGETEDFMVKIDVHQKLAFNSYLFSLVMNKLTKGV